jgi:hypothetical protein
MEDELEIISAYVESESGSQLSGIQNFSITITARDFRRLVDKCCGPSDVRFKIGSEM